MVVERPVTERSILYPSFDHVSCHVLAAKDNHNRPKAKNDGLYDAHTLLFSFQRISFRFNAILDPVQCSVPGRAVLPQRKAKLQGDGNMKKKI